MKRKVLLLGMALATLTAAQAQKSGAELPLVYDVENTGAKMKAPKMAEPERLPEVRELPNALEGVKTFKQWAQRRSDIGHMIQHYGIG